MRAMRSRKGFKTWSRDTEEKPKGYSLRMGQLMGPYSIGSIYPGDANNTLMIAGLDAFRIDKMEQVDDDRLAKHIGVSRLYAPPVYDETRGTIPAVRFPGWYFCPSCKRMEYVDQSNTSKRILCADPKCVAKHKRGMPMVPERFIVVCPQGHADDFPVMRWVHYGTEVSPKDPGHVVRRYTGGGDATMGDIHYRCSCGAHRTLQGAMSYRGLEGIGYSCGGRQPWLGRRISQQGCDVPHDQLRVVVMGGTNVCYADTVSSVLIPDSLDEGVKSVARENFEDLAEAEEGGSLQLLLKSVAKNNKVDPEALRIAYEKMKDGGEDALNESEYLYEEYQTLRDPKVFADGKFVGSRVDTNDYASDLIRTYVSGVALIDTITVTRALVGLTRLNPEANEGRSMRDRRRSLSRKQLDWTLAVQSVGEGIFLEFDESELETWSKRDATMRRFDNMQKNLDASRKGRKQELKQLNPRYVVLHTLAHLLMLGISEVCGYTAASLRERVYCDRYVDDDLHEEMNGVLIYTASGSSDGSLGGLVRSGRPGHLESILGKALEEALWCSGDPVCIESQGQGLDSCNLAACYSCALVPETSCEAGNKFLDRALVVGTIDNPETGLFGLELRC